MLATVLYAIYLTLSLSHAPHVVHRTFDSDVREPYVAHTSILFQLVIKLKTFEYRALD